MPSEVDFDPYGGCLDAQSAWEDFGGLSIRQVYDLFMTNTICYQENFMFMGSRAFEYYLPVIDRYLREVSYEDELDDCEAAILGSAVAVQFEWKGSHLSPRTVAEIEELSAFVMENRDRYSPLPSELERIEIEWNRVDENIATYRNKGE